MYFCGIATGARRPVFVPLVPGILPITRFPQLLRFAERYGASVLQGLVAPALRRIDDDPETRRMIAANVAIEQVQRFRMSTASKNSISIP